MASYEGTTDSKAEEAASDEASSSPNELKQYRQTAQQNSVDTIRAAEERYEKAKQSSAKALGQTKDAAKQGVGAAMAYVAGKGTQAKDSAATGLRVAADYAAEKGREGYDYSKRKSLQCYHAAKDSAVKTGQTVSDHAQQATSEAKDFVVQKGHEAKDATVDASHRAMDYAGQKAGQAKDAVAGAGRRASQKCSESKEKLEEETHIAEGKLSKMSLGGEGEEQTKAAAPEESKKGGTDYTESEERDLGEKKSGFLGAVGETVIGIAKSAKNLVIGGEDSQQKH